MRRGAHAGYDSYRLREDGRGLGWCIRTQSHAYCMCLVVSIRPTLTDVDSNSRPQDRVDEHCSVNRRWVMGDGQVVRPAGQGSFVRGLGSARLIGVRGAEENRR